MNLTEWFQEVGYDANGSLGMWQKTERDRGVFSGLLDCVDFLIDSYVESFMGREVYRPDIFSDMADVQVVIFV